MNDNKKALTEELVAAVKVAKRTQDAAVATTQRAARAEAIAAQVWEAAMWTALAAKDKD